MPGQVSESLILRTYPLRESDLIVSFFTREHGKLRGVAPRARKPKSSFGAGLQRLSYVRMFYVHRENRELCNLNSCELIQSQFSIAEHYEASVALDFIAEVTDDLLPDSEPSERFFRLIVSVLDYLRANPKEGVWPAILYFGLWAVRLSGFLPELQVRTESAEIGEEMMRTPISQLAPREWSRATAADLRRFVTRQIQDHIEKRLQTAQLIETL
jgi:DNA repair protein RecO (recombination protein O)